MATSVERTDRNPSRKLPPQPLTREEVAALLDTLHTRYFTGARDRMIVLLLWRAQMRISEVLALRPEDVDLQECSITILHGKGDRARVVGVDQQTVEELTRWFARRALEGFGQNEWLFPTHRGRQVLAGHMRNKLKRLARKAGTKKRVHCHGFRHTGATELLREGVPLPVIQAQLGHSNLSTTYTYLRHLCPREVIDRMKARTW